MMPYVGQFKLMMTSGAVVEYFEPWKQKHASYSVT